MSADEFLAAWDEGTHSRGFDLPLKDDTGPPEILGWLNLAAEGIDASERNIDLGASWRARYEPALERASRWIDEHGGF